MQVIHNDKGYPQCPTRYFHFDEYESKLGDFILMEGGFGIPTLWDEYNLSSTELIRLKKKKVVRFEFEEPNKFFVADYPQKYDHEFHKIFTICPYTAEWLNKKYGEEKRIPIYYPIDHRYIPPKTKKDIDVIYSGHILSWELRNELSKLENFNYALVSNSEDRLVTHRSVSYADKLKLYARSKIALVHNVFFKQYPHRIMNVWFSGDYWNNKAFTQIPSPIRSWELFKSKMYVPQLKSRVFEAAMGRSLILCMKDEWRVIERYFEPNKEFIYYEPETLVTSIQMILDDYSKYAKIAERAYERAIKHYTVKNFVQEFLTNI